MHKPKDNHLLDELENSILRPLKIFLDFYGRNTKWFIQQIDEETPAASQIIDDFARYGMFYILVPFNEVLSTYQPTKLLKSWQKKWDNLKCNNTLVHSIAEAFHAQLIQESQTKDEDLTTIVKYVSGCDLYKKIWRSYPDDFWQYPQSQENLDIYLGVLIPGIYTVSLEPHYMEAVYDNAFPQLFLLKRHMNKFPINKTLQSLIYQTVLYYSSELGYQYYTLTSKVAAKMIYTGKLDSNDEEYARFFEHEALEENGLQLNMTLDRVNKLEKLSDCVEQFGFTQPSCRMLVYFIPVAQQLVGKISPASKKLMALYHQIDVNTKTDRVFLLANYRMWVRESGEAKQRAFAILTEMGIEQLVDILKVYYDIAAFYKQFCIEFVKRFDKRELNGLLTHSFEEDFRFYSMWDPNDEGNIWFFETFIKSNILFQLFEGILQKCEGEKTDVNKMLSWMYFMDELFYPLTSHLYISNVSRYENFRRIRVNTELLLRACNDIIPYLGLNLPQICLPHAPPEYCTELFEIYSPSQIEILIQLRTRMDEACKNRPKQLPKAIVQLSLEQAPQDTNTMVHSLENSVSFEFDDIVKFFQSKLREAIYHKPEKEIEVQNAIESLLLGKGLSKGTDYDRESGKFKFSGKEYIPDFIVHKLSLCIEVKLLRVGRRSKIIEEISADITAYRKNYPRQLFVVYDLGEIQNEAEFKQDIEKIDGIKVIIVKH